MKVFISHAHEERRLAAAWSDLLENISRNQIDVWYSSNPRPDHGMTTGEWAEQIWKELESSTVNLTLVTPDSGRRTWLAHESGIARGRSIPVSPIVYFMKIDKLPGIYKDYEAFDGEDLDSVGKLCIHLVSQLDGVVPTQPVIASWAGFIEEYSDVVKAERRDTYARSLFHDRFHASETAEKLEGKWYAKWTQYTDEGEKVFEVDCLHAWTSADRFRMVGDGQKGEPYPMEGVISWNGNIAMSYWSQGDIAICGTVLMKPSPVIPNLLVGNWQGYTALSLDAPELKYFRGRVVMSRKEEIATKHWGLLPGKTGPADDGLA
jgi:hypothetical protein